MEMRNLLLKLEKILLIALMLVMGLAVTLQIVGRYLFKFAVFFSEESALLCYVWLSFLGMSYATRDDTHIRMDLLENYCGKTARAIMQWTVLLISAAVMVITIVAGSGFIYFDRYGRTAALRMSSAVFNAAIVVGAVLNLMQIIRKIAKMLRVKS